LAVQTRDIAAAEDARGDALVSALAVWPERGVPENPEAWLVTAARNRLRNVARSGQVRRLAEPEIIRRLEECVSTPGLPDERLRLMFVCAHPAIDPGARTPLILQTVLGLDAAQIARAFLVEPSAMGQRLVRAKARIRDAGIRFELPEPEDMSARVAAVLDAIYAAFGAAWDGWEQPEAPDALTGEAIWLARLLVSLMPQEPEPKGLLALMLYCTARRRARRDAEGRFIPLDRQDARLWNRDMIIEAEGLLTAAARIGRFGRYQCEAAIQSVHVQRPITGKPNHEALLALYNALIQHADSIGARIGRATVLAETGNTAAALEALQELPASRVDHHQPYWVALSHAQEKAGDLPKAADALQKAIALTPDRAVSAYLGERLKSITERLGDT
ncbi:MAG TPA: DUF6596 domain-containing protein, partial [Rhizobiaceae bacterium]|nr:DUF6596 domain-containing protein [Rhizobiaceae bacterium]